MGLDLRTLVVNWCGMTGTSEAARQCGVDVSTVLRWRVGDEPIPIAVAQHVIESMEGASEVETLKWHGQKVAVLMPRYSKMEPETHQTLFKSYARYGPEKVAFIHGKENTCVWKARNILIEKWLATEIPFGLFCDSDMILPFGDALAYNAEYGAGLPPARAGLDFFTRIMSHPASYKIIGATYYGRDPTGQVMCSKGLQDPGFSPLCRRGEIAGVIPVSWVATGAMRVHRSVPEMMKARALELFPEIVPQLGRTIYEYMLPSVAGNGEDVEFCARAAKLGIQSYMDAELICMHKGHAYYGPRNTH